MHGSQVRYDGQIEEETVLNDYPAIPCRESGSIRWTALLRIPVRGAVPEEKRRIGNFYKMKRDTA